MKSQAIFAIDHRHTLDVTFRGDLGDQELHLYLEHLPDSTRKLLGAGGRFGKETHLREVITTGAYLLSAQLRGEPVVELAIEPVHPSEDHASYLILDTERRCFAVLRVLADARGTH
jgi:hypothetical protein